MDGHSSEILDFYRAYEWQLGLVSEQSKLCTDLSLDDLEALVKQSGRRECSVASCRQHEVTMRSKTQIL